MKKTNYFKLIALAMICFFSITMSAQTLVTDSLSFANAIADLQSPTGSTLGAGGVIQLDASLVLRPWKQTYILASTPAAPIEINTQQYSITVSGTSATGDSTILKIGDNMNIHGTSTVLTNLNRGIIRITGGLIKSSTSIAGTAAVLVNSGWIFVSGGTISVEATAPVANAYAINVLNNFNLVLRGGTISAIGDNTVALSLTDNVSPTAFTNTTITATGEKAYAIQSLGGNTATVGDNMTITTSSTSGTTDAALVGGGSTSKIIIPAIANNVVLTSAHKYLLTNVGSAVIDLRGLTLSASPVDGSSLVYPANNVTLTASGNESSATCGIYYSYITAPTASSPNIASGGTAPASAATTVLKAAFGKNGFVDTNVYTFNYTVSGLPANLPIDVTTFADFLTAYTNSQTGTPRTTTINLLATLTTTGAYSIVPSVDYPVIITANTFSIKTGSAGTFGGYLSMSNSSTSTLGLIQFAGAFTTNITGGTYTANNNAGVIYANTGAGVENVNAKLYLSNATFTVNGSTGAASIVKFVTTNGNLLSINNCILNASAKAQVINCLGPLNISISNSTVINIAGSDASSIAVNYAPTNAASNSLIVDGLTLNMNAGTGFSLGGTKALSGVVKNLTVNGTLTNLYLKNTATTTYYDFRAFTPTVDVPAGTYLTTQTVTLSLTPTAVSPVDASAATIVYTLDGTEPTAASTAYTTPLSIAATTTVKMAALAGGFVGNSATFTYTINTSGNVSLKDESVISIYPTVVENTVTINNMARNIQVVDLAGKLMLQKTNAAQFDMSALQAGVYMVKVISSDNTVKTFKVVKQ